MSLVVQVSGYTGLHATLVGHLTAFLHHTSLRHLIPNFKKFLLLQNLALTELSNLRITLLENLL